MCESRAPLRLHVAVRPKDCVLILLWPTQVEREFCASLGRAMYSDDDAEHVRERRLARKLQRPGMYTTDTRM